MLNVIGYSAPENTYNGQQYWIFYGKGLCGYAGLCNRLLVKVYSYYGTPLMKCALYDYTTLKLLGTTEEKTINATGWWSFNFVTRVPVSPMTYYYLACYNGGDNTYNISEYDTGSGDSGGYQNVGSYGNFPDPAVITTQPVYYCMYVVYSMASLAAGRHATAHFRRGMRFLPEMKLTQ